MESSSSSPPRHDHHHHRHDHRHRRLRLRLRRTKLTGTMRSLGSCLWICPFGFFFVVAIVLYSALDRYGFQERGFGSGGGSQGGEPPSIAVFAAPRPFELDGVDPVGKKQEMAVRSWLALAPEIGVVLFGTHPSVLALAETLGPRVAVETAIDFTFLGTPFFHSMVARSQATQSDISILIDPETILLPDILTTLTNIHKLKSDWFLFSSSRSISYFPYQLVGTGIWVQEDGKKIESKKLQEILVHKWTKSACRQRLLMAWNSAELPLLEGILPPFLYGKGFHDLWIINEVLSSEMRLVFDASNALFCFYPENLGEFSNNYSEDSNVGTERIWEREGNHRLAALYGSLYFQNANPPNTLFKILKCSGQYYFLNEAKGAVQEATRAQLLGSLLNSGHRNCKACTDEINSMKEENPCSLMQLPKLDLEMPVPLRLPFSLESLLEIVADRDKNVVLGIAGTSYRDMLMSWACRLRHLGVTNFIVCALDFETYEFSVLQGLPAFMDPMSPRNVSFDDCHFGTECFQRVTKVKSRIVLQILKLGYNVLLSDVDVYWFNNPLPYLLSFGPGTFVAQSDEYNETGPINIPRRLNSGFYFVRSDLASITAIEMVVKHASTSGLSEQPSFYDVLCGEGGMNRVGDNQCFEPKTNLTVFFLDRNFFPNGAYMGLWEKPDVRSACLKLRCFILHNNWINGRKRKLERQIQSGLWDYDPSSRLCIQNWHNYTKFVGDF